MRNQWFIIQALSGQEHKVKESIEKRIKAEEMQDFIKEVLVPMEKVVEVRNQARSRDLATRAIEAATTQQTPAWLGMDKKAFRGEVLSVPTREQIAPIVNEQAVVELYSR